VDFYGEVLQELVVALGAALFVANVLALVRRRNDAAAANRRTVARARAGSPVRGYRRDAKPGTTRDRDLPQAPVARSVLYAVIGFVVMVWGVASLVR
jgi:hypothetical protein